MRLRILAEYGLFDTAPEPSFDRLTAQASRMFRAPVALISLVGHDRQWLKSHHGWAVCETVREVSFCAHAITLPNPEDVLVVPDATQDPRFVDNPLVTGSPGIRFYAGAPLRTPDGHALGSLCIIDLTPRAEFSDEDRAALVDLAATAAEVLDLQLTKRRYEKEAAQRRNAEARRMSVLEAALDGIITIDHEGRVIELNRAAETMFGHTQAQAVGQELAELIIPPVYRAAHRRGMAHFLATGEGSALNKRLELSAMRANGEEFPVELAITRIATDGAPVFTGHIRDITDRRRTEAEARRSAQRVQTVLESITDAFYSLDRQWRFTYVNEQAQRVLECPRGDLLGRSFWDVFPDKARVDYYPEFQRALEIGQPSVFELYSEPLGKWLGVHAYPSEEGLSVYMQDISERKQTQKALEDNLALMRAIINGTDNHIFIKDLDSRYLLINPAGATILGTPPEAVAGKDDSAFFPPESVLGNRNSDVEIMRSGESRTYESSDIINGVEHVFLSTKSPYRDATGKLLGIIGIAREITAQRRAAVALREAKEEAEKANQAKSEFLSRMSHELRTPLNAILGFGQLLELSNLGSNQGESVDHILKAGRHLLDLIDEVLAISRIEAGRMQLSLEPVALGETVRECLSLVGRQAADRGVRFLDGCSDGTAHVLADRQRLRQVLLNLFSNAIKYNREGGSVTLSCREVCAAGEGQNGDPGPAFLRIAVTDTGHGLDAEEIRLLFTPFERLRAERTSTEGTGLGLALSKGLIETMGGRINVDSVPGEGSTFWIELPLAAHPGERVGREAMLLPGLSTEALRGCVLYIEDNLSNLQLIQMLLGERPGLELLSAQQGALGLEIARARKPDLILLDLHLPDLPGWEVLKMLQADPSTRDLPVVVVSADATANRIDRLLKAGARDYLTKPLNVRGLLGVLREYLRPGIASLAPADKR